MEAARFHDIAQRNGGLGGIGYLNANVAFARHGGFNADRFCRQRQCQIVGQTGNFADLNPRAFAVPHFQIVWLDAKLSDGGALVDFDGGGGCAKAGKGVFDDLHLSLDGGIVDGGVRARVEHFSDGGDGPARSIAVFAAGVAQEKGFGCWSSGSGFSRLCAALGLADGKFAHRWGWRNGRFWRCRRLTLLTFSFRQQRELGCWAGSATAPWINPDGGARNWFDWLGMLLQTAAERCPNAA